LKKSLLIFIISFLLIFSTSVLAVDKDQKKVEAKAVALAEEEHKFSDQAKEELLGIASLFDNNATISDTENSLNQLNINFDTPVEGEEAVLLDDNLRLNADYNETVSEDKLNAVTDLQLEYDFNSRTLFRAGYTMANKKWWDDSGITRPDLTNNEQSSDIKNNNSLLNNDSNNQSTSDNLSVNSEEPTFNSETDKKKSFGISYKTSDHLTVSADFIENNEIDDQIKGDSTVFGVSYTDELGVIRAIYQLDDSQDVKQQSTGLEFDIKDLATFSASYKLLDPEEIKSTLLSEKAVWNFGVGLSLNESSKVNLDYEVEEAAGSNDKKESNIKASFAIEF